MSPNVKLIALFAAILLISDLPNLAAQDEISWLEDYTGEMSIGNDTYQYRFNTVDGNECKVQFKELVTDKRGSTESRSWTFYLSDIDPKTVRFDTRGKSIEVNMESRNSHEFISYYEEDEFEEYTDEIELTMLEVDKTRDFIDILKEKIGSCHETEAAWEDREAAFDWLITNIGDAVDDDVEWEQEFTRGEKPYLAEMRAVSVDDGELESTEYLFDLSDVNPLKISLEVSGRSLAVEVPVADGEDYIEVSTSGGTEYTDEFMIYADDIEVARQIVNALTYLVSNTETERPAWESYSEALKFVKTNLKQVEAGGDLYEYSLDFEDSPSGTVELTETETGEDGETEEVTYSFYLADMEKRAELDVSGDEVTIAMDTRDDRDYIREISGGSVSDYISGLEFLASGIDVARDVIHALEFAAENSVEEIVDFSSVGEVNTWMQENLVTLYREDEEYKQSLFVLEDGGTHIVFDLAVTEEGEVTENQYLIYPEDINTGELDIDVSWGRLNVTLETEGDDFIKHHENGLLQDYTDDVDVYFSDPMVAKNFIAAIRFLKDQIPPQDQPEWNSGEAMAFLTGNIPTIELPEERHEQSLEAVDGDDCKLRFTRVETDDGGDSDEYIFEFVVSDIHEGNSEISTDGKLIEVTLVTAGEEELIRPYENGEMEDFEDEFTVYADDVLKARQILAAFGILSEACK